MASNPEIPQTLKKLAAMLQLRQRQTTRAYNLLLTSDITLTPTALQNICGSSSWSEFRSYIRTLGQSDQLAVLSHYIDQQTYLPGYKALARLIKNGYFSTILTTNLDSMLEDALVEEGLRPTLLQTLIVGRDNPEHIARSLDNHTNGVRIIKLHGSLREGVLPRQFPDIFELPRDIRDSLTHYINQDIVIIGSIRNDNDIVRALSGRSGPSIYYALPQTPSSDDDVVKALIAREKTPEAFMITGSCGQFNPFFVTLESTIVAQPSTTQSDSSPDHATSKAEQNIQAETLSSADDQRLTADVLIITTTEVEAASVLNLIPENTQRYIRDKTYYDLGTIGGARTFMVQSEMGSGGPGGSLLTVAEGIRALTPSAIIMVGIAFGYDATKQRIGDILVSQQIVAYDLQRVGTAADGTADVLVRGDRSTASIRLLDRFKSGRRNWPRSPRVRFGLILSGEKLVDNLDYREQLRTYEPEAIGGEMEGIGLYAAAQRFKVDWLLVKAICDWADGNKHQNKSKRQKQAADNAARFTLHVIRQGGLP